MTGHSPMPVALKTERLILRPWQESDVDSYLELVRERDDRSRDPERGDVLPTEDVIRARIASQQLMRERTGLALLPIFRRVDRDFIGYCGLTVGRASVEEPELAFELLRRSHRHGYATEAAGAVVDAAWRTGRRRLWATVRSWNARSFRVLQKLEFERDHVSVDERGELVWMSRAAPLPRC